MNKVVPVSQDPVPDGVAAHAWGAMHTLGRPINAFREISAWNPTYGYIIYKYMLERDSNVSKNKNGSGVWCHPDIRPMDANEIGLNKTGCLSNRST